MLTVVYLTSATELLVEPALWRGGPLGLPGASGKRFRRASRTQPEALTMSYGQVV